MNLWPVEHFLPNLFSRSCTEVTSYEIHTLITFLFVLAADRRNLRRSISESKVDKDRKNEERAVRARSVHFDGQISEQHNLTKTNGTGKDTNDKVNPYALS